ncbi:hypothetical protein Afil01_62600 [Actinorhabdospora filicis]|uniref:Uncharacterized protein n=1 Tax=Actinorhabdospora filicis TaxID=1785913 RepID=A0A9W6SSC1_9ACTN|nr:hypothetical protein [Actinorhabdospora filicis]GLZ81453.1 hypothetical protein Afil01_62600 [Actinorhabdospora filicis]
MRLSVGNSAAVKILGSVVVLFLLTAATGVSVGIATGYDIMTMTPHPGDEGPRVLLLVPFAAAIVAIFAMLSIWRTAAWLHGTRLTHRSTFGLGTVDLARAGRLWFEERKQRTTSRQGDMQVTTTYSVPLLCAEDAGTVVRLPLAWYGRRVPHTQLSMLAAAIESGYRPGPAGDHARAAAAQLRVM